MKQAQVLTRDELKRVLAFCAGTKHGNRNRMAVLLSHYAGLRVGEIAQLTWQHLLDQSGAVKHSFRLHAHETKAKEVRLIHVNAKLQRELQRFHARSTYTQSTQPVIPSQKGGHFSPNSLCQLFARIYAAVGLTDASSHSGRRWFITQLAHSGVSAKVIMELAGHRQLNTTQRYIDVTEAMKANAVELL